MKKKILFLTLAMVLIMGTGVLIAGNMHGHANGNDNWGSVAQPTGVTAEYGAHDTITICWDDPAIDPQKWAVVLFFKVYFEWDEECLDYFECDSCPYQLCVELDYSANKNVYTPTEGENAGKKCIDLSGEGVYYDVADYLNSELEDCMNCQSMDCLDSWTADPTMIKVKGLDPGHGNGRQNNQFSDPVQLINYDLWYDLWVGYPFWFIFF